jgi:hypothetical protein
MALFYEYIKLAFPLASLMFVSKAGAYQSVSTFQVLR